MGEFRIQAFKGESNIGNRQFSLRGLSGPLNVGAGTFSIATTPEDYGTTVGFNLKGIQLEETNQPLAVKTFWEPITNGLVALAIVTPIYVCAKATHPSLHIWLSAWASLLNHLQKVPSTCGIPKGG